MAFLKERGVGSEVYYPVPLHLQACFKDMGYAAGSLPNAECAAQETLALPIYPELGDAKVRHVVDVIARYFS